MFSITVLQWFVGNANSEIQHLQLKTEFQFYFSPIPRYTGTVHQASYLIPPVPHLQQNNQEIPNLYRKYYKETGSNMDKPTTNKTPSPLDNETKTGKIPSPPSGLPVNGM